MPGKFNLQNTSVSDVNVTINSSKLLTLKSEPLGSIPGRLVVLKPGELYSSIVNNGILSLTIKDDNDEIWWTGLVPSYGPMATQIDFENKKVTSGKQVMVNLSSPNLSSSNFSEKKSFLGGKYIIILIAILIVILAILLYYKFR